MVIKNKRSKFMIMKTKFVKQVLQWVLFALLIVIAGWVIGMLIGGGFPALIIITIIVFVLLLALFFYLFSDKILLRWYHAKEERDTNSPLCEIVGKLAEKADIPAPKVFIVDSAMPNAFAIGRNVKHASIIVTKALIELLDKEEIEAVLAHELAHVKNGNTQRGSVVAVLSGMLMAVATFAFWASIFTGFGQEDDPAPNIIFFFFASLVAPVAAAIIQFFVPRSREYVADEQSKQSVSMHGKADKLASALDKIEERLKSTPFAANPAHVHLFLVNPLHDAEFKVMDFRLPTYNLLFYKEKKERFRIAKPLFFSFISYLFVLFVIIAIDTFSNKDFVFARAAAISVVYLGALLLLFALMAVLFRVKLKNHEISRD